LRYKYVEKTIKKEAKRMEIKVLGTGCAKCKKLEEMVREVVGELGVDADIVKISDLNEILEYDIMMTPGLVVNGEVVCSGRIPKKEEIRKWLQQE
jgi:small redox-active disulfide protein 2